MRSIIVLSLLLIPAVSGISDNCLRAVCEVASDGCRARPCLWDDNRRGCGYFHISREYYRNCGSPGAGWLACSKNRDCSQRCVRNYLSRYGTRCTGGRFPTCQDYARIHFGGPRGCHSSHTESDWWKVQRRL